jgi:ribosome-interacting GTPase 1
MVGAKKSKPVSMKTGGTVKDACYKKVKSQYKVFPSAYASGAIAKCRKKGSKS